MVIDIVMVMDGEGYGIGDRDGNRDSRKRGTRPELFGDRIDRIGSYGMVWYAGARAALYVCACAREISLVAGGAGLDWGEVGRVVFR